MVAKVLRKFYEYRTATLVARESSNILPQSAQSQSFELVADLGRLCAAYAWLAPVALPCQFSLSRRWISVAFARTGRIS